MTGVTRKQYECLTFINERVRESGVSPSYDEISAALDMKAKSGVHRLICGLEERGFIRRRPRLSRSLEILKLPDNLSDRLSPASGRSQYRQSDDNRHAPVQAGVGAVNVPLVGRIAAGGTPIEALQNKVGDVVVPGGMIGRGNHYALEVTGDAMVNAGILDGDTIVICETARANQGDLVIVLVDKNCVFFRRYRYRGGNISLQAANPAYQDFLYAADRIAIQGRMVGLIRRY